jgi:zinc protease
MLAVLLLGASIASAADYRMTTLDNGLTVIISPDPTSPVVTLCIVVKTGATCETPETNGLAHFYEHMFFKGNAALPDQTAYNRRMGELGIVRNGTTYPERVQYYITLGADRLEEGLGFMFDAITSPLFDQEEMEKERQVIMNEYERGLTQPFHPLWEAKEAVIFADAPWRMSGIGEPEVIQSASPPAMRFFQETYYTPDNSALIIAGDVDPDSALALVREMYSAWEPAGRSDYDSLPLLIRIDRDTTVFLDSPSGLTYVTVIYEGPSISSDPGASYPADVWGSYLSLMSREFYRDLVTDGPFLDIFASYYTQRFSPSISFGGNVADGMEEEALRLLLEEIGQLQSPDYYDPEGLELAKEELRRSRILSEETSTDVAVESLPFWWTATGSLDYYATYLDSVQTVELDDVTGFIGEWLVGRPRAVFVMAPSPGEVP